MESSRYIPNDFDELRTLERDPKAYLMQALTDIVENYPPNQKWKQHDLGGLWTGPTGTAYLFFLAAVKYPHNADGVGRLPLRNWADLYVDSPGHLRQNVPSSHGCGIHNDNLCFGAVRGAMLGRTKPNSLSWFEDQVKMVADNPGAYPDELLYGRAGALYLARMVCSWVATEDVKARIKVHAKTIRDQMLRNGPQWQWHGKRYLGAVHGDIGIITQLVLTFPNTASKLAKPLEQLLDMQQDDGNWPSSDGHKRKTAGGLVQFCHGAAGFVHSLQVLRPYFPALQQRIDTAIERARDCIWREGLLKKEPSLCHGIFGNALALEPGPRRNHFLAIATPEGMAALEEMDGTTFEPADYGRPYSTLTSYAPSAAWAWLQWDMKVPGILGYTDCLSPIGSFDGKRVKADKSNAA